MGAALLQDPNRLCSILEALVSQSGKPVSCKIRISKNISETISLCHRIVSTGVSALTVHCRTPSERPKDPGDWDVFPLLMKEIKGIPLIANGDLFSLQDCEKLKSLSGVSSFMFARGAQNNPSIFRVDGQLPIFEAAQRYLQISIDTDNVFQNTKYALLQMWPDFHTDIGQKILHAKSYSDLNQIFGTQEYYEKVSGERDILVQSNGWQFYQKISELYPLDNAELQERIEGKIGV